MKKFFSFFKKRPKVPLPEPTPIQEEEGYCVKCKIICKMLDPTPVRMKNGRPAMKGKHKDCGTMMFRIDKP